MFFERTFPSYMFKYCMHSRKGKVLLLHLRNIHPKLLRSPILRPTVTTPALPQVTPGLGQTTPVLAPVRLQVPPAPPGSLRPLPPQSPHPLPLPQPLLRPIQVNHHVINICSLLFATSFFLYLKSVPIHVIVHVHVMHITYCTRVFF